MGWKRYEDAAGRGPISFIWVLVPVLLCILGVGWILHEANSTAQVVHNEFGAQALLDKYSWFKNAAAALTAKKADVEVYQGRLTGIEKLYEGVPRNKWARADAEQYTIWASEVAGVKASYNALAGEYNSNMAKFNWRFANAGNLPAGADQVLPREFAPYIFQ